MPGSYLQTSVPKIQPKVDNFGDAVAQWTTVITKKREPFAKGTFSLLSSRQVAASTLLFCLNIRHVSQQELKWEGRERNGMVREIERAHV